MLSSLNDKTSEYDQEMPQSQTTDHHTTALFAVCKQSLKINTTILASELNILAKYEYFQTGMSESVTIHITMMKNCVSRILLF